MGMGEISIEISNLWVGWIMWDFYHKNLSVNIITCWEHMLGASEISYQPTGMYISTWIRVNTLKVDTSEPSKINGTWLNLSQKQVRPTRFTI